MIRFLTRRFLKAILVLVGVTFFSFGMIFLNGDPATLMAGESWTQQDLQNFRHAMGFDRPWPVQYVEFVSKAVHGDFGVSLRQRQPAMELVLQRMPATLQLALAAMLLSIVIAFPIGIVSAVRRNSIWDQMARFLALLGQAMPVFWLGIMLILVFAVRLRWFPVSGRGSWQSLVLPAVALSMYPLARNIRMVRSSLLEVLRLDYIVTARAKGLSYNVVLVRHALRNALIPVVTLIGLDFGALLGGAIVTESVFAWPGVGRLTVQAIYGKDFPIVQAAVTVLAIIFILINLAMDIIYSFLDPRIKYE
jgi:ABC-type dipeptide/oligopeptide/nickel transport system permease component